MGRRRLRLGEDASVASHHQRQRLGPPDVHADRDVDSSLSLGPRLQFAKRLGLDPMGGAGLDEVGNRHQQLHLEVVGDPRPVAVGLEAVPTLEGLGEVALV